MDLKNLTHRQTFSNLIVWRGSTIMQISGDSASPETAAAQKAEEAVLQQALPGPGHM